ncbi:MAG: restriction endonuclease [Lachnospiraceae bacterium]|nr:restriction endonuclease [Lachnospiraceae bacterium]
MLNYENLSDYEFENLCCDIMSKKLGVQLRIFATGRDGGIDATDDTKMHNIVVQAKHYIRSGYTALMRTLRGEVEKVKQLNPNQYYVCCAQKLTPGNISEIYDLFSEYMCDTNNVIDLNVIDTFLNKPENSDVLRKHYKLWLESTEILSQIYNKNIFIDCEVLLADIEEQSKFFVETNYYYESIKVLDRSRILMLLGLPGVGKTVTTKMVALHYASLGYCIRFTTDGSITNLKKVVSESEEKKELIILDDCLGQAYFKMKENQENELISLIKYVSRHNNKKIIMNSRITIYNEAKEHSGLFADFFDDKDNLIKYIDMNNLSIENKGQIFFNHLYFKGVPREYYNNIIKDKVYKRIVLHVNYCPRIIEFVTKRKQYESILPENYANYLIECLRKPSEVWKEEYRFRIQQEDRLLLTTMFSLTDTIVKNDILKRAYNERMKHRSGVDVTQNYYENALKRMNGSMIKLVDKDNQIWVGAANPSVNDFLREILFKNALEYEDIKEHCTEYIQILRLFPEYLEAAIINGRAENLHYVSEEEKYAVILSFICTNKVYNEGCKNIVCEYLGKLISFQIDGKASYIEVICTLLSGEMNAYYSSRQMLDEMALIKLFENMDMNEFAEMLQWYEQYDIDLEDDNIETIMIKEVNRAITDYCTNVPGEEYYEEYDVKMLLDSCLESKDVFRYCSNGDPYIDQEYELDYDRAHQIVLEYIVDDIKEEIASKFMKIPSKFVSKIMLEPQEKDFEIDLSSLDEYLDSQFEPMEPDYYDYDEDYGVRDYVGDVLDCIFRDGAI